MQSCKSKEIRLAYDAFTWIRIQNRVLYEYFFYTFGIMLSQFAAVECKVLIQAGRGSLSRLCFLQHKGKLEQMLIPHLRNKGNGCKLSAQ